MDLKNLPCAHYCSSGVAVSWCIVTLYECQHETWLSFFSWQKLTLLSSGFLLAAQCSLQLKNMRHSWTLNVSCSFLSVCGCLWQQGDELCLRKGCRQRDNRTLEIIRRGLWVLRFSLINQWPAMLQLHLLILPQLTGNLDRRVTKNWMEQRVYLLVSSTIFVNGNTKITVLIMLKRSLKWSVTKYI